MYPPYTYIYKHIQYTRCIQQHLRPEAFPFAPPARPGSRRSRRRPAASLDQRSLFMLISWLTLKGEQKTPSEILAAQWLDFNHSKPQEAKIRSTTKNVSQQQPSCLVFPNFCRFYLGVLFFQATPWTAVQGNHKDATYSETHVEVDRTALYMGGPLVGKPST